LGYQLEPESLQKPRLGKEQKALQLIVVMQEALKASRG
jgi:hypothetical protein